MYGIGHPVSKVKLSASQNYCNTLGYRKLLFVGTNKSLLLNCVVFLWPQMNGIALIIFLFVFERRFMITTFPKLQCVILTLVLLLFSALPVSTYLMDEGKTESAIKMLVFPKSLWVIKSRGDEMNAVFSDPKRIRKTLLKLDPARVAPTKSGEPINGPVTRDSLRQLAN
jgi:hypothetical protein